MSKTSSESKTELIYVRTIPHTGTHFLIRLLNSSPDICVVPVDVDSNIVRKPRGIDSHFSPIIKKVVQNEISSEEFKKLMILATILRTKAQLLEDWEQLDRLNRSDRKLEYRQVIADVANNNIPDLDCDFKYICLLEHVVPERLNGKYWLNDIIKNGHDIKTISTLRDPVQVMMTLMLRTTTSETYDNHPEIPMLYNGFIEFVKNRKSNRFLLPIDTSKENVMGKAIEMFSNFLGSEITPIMEKMIYDWKKIHDTRVIDIPHLTSQWKKDIIEYRKEVENGEYRLGSNRYIDNEISYYSSVDGLQELFEEHGYKYLLWFK